LTEKFIQKTIIYGKEIHIDMIEVEKKFQPTPEQLAKLLDGAEFLGEVTLHDLYYDFADLRLIKNDIRLRKRNDGYELKIGAGNGIAQELETEEDIQKYFGTEIPIGDFVRENMFEVINFKNHRKKYKKDNFTIDVDSMDFGYQLVEIELLVSDESEIAEAEQKIYALAESFGIEKKKLPQKREEYFRLKKPEIYRELYG